MKLADKAKAQKRSGATNGRLSDSCKTSAGIQVSLSHIVLQFPFHFYFQVMLHPLGKSLLFSGENKKKKKKKTKLTCAEEQKNSRDH